MEEYTRQQMQFFLAGLVLGLTSELMPEHPGKCLTTVLLDKYATDEEFIDKLMVSILEYFSGDLAKHREEHDK